MEENFSVSTHISKLLPRIQSIDVGWLHQWIPEELVKHCRPGSQASRLLLRQLSKSHELRLPDKVDLEAHERWLLLTISNQRRLALLLGSQACATFVRIVVSKPQLEKLLKVVGEKQYNTLLGTSSLEVEGLPREDFDRALEGDGIDLYLTAVGVALLEMTLSRDDRFFSARMRFSFQPACWSLRPRAISTDLAGLKLRVMDISRTMETEFGKLGYE